MSRTRVRPLLLAACCAAFTPHALGDATEDAQRIQGFGETYFPQFFSPPGAKLTTLAGYLAAYYPGTQNYLGIKDSLVYVYGDVFGGLRNVGSVPYFLAVINGEGREAEFAPAPGTYTGQTSQRQPVTIEVGPGGAITSLRVSLRWSMGLDSCTAPFTAPTAPETAARRTVVNGGFDTPVVFAGGLSTRFAGSFRSGTFSGVFDANDQPSCSYICGSRFILGTCGSMWGNGTWQATRQ